MSMFDSTPRQVGSEIPESTPCPTGVHQVPVVVEANGSWHGQNCEDCYPAAITSSFEELQVRETGTVVDAPEELPADPPPADDPDPVDPDPITDPED